jgi:hypothetical protein
MVDLGIDHISITRRLPIAPGALDAVVTRLRYENGGSTARWTLGERGSCEFDVTFSRADAAFLSTAMLWAPERQAFATLAVSLAPCDGGQTELALHPCEPIGEWWSDRLPAFLDLAHAALEELAEELLWQHSRVAHDRAS